MKLYSISILAIEPEVLTSGNLKKILNVIEKIILSL